MNIDWTISIGNIIQIIAMLGGGLFVVLALRWDVSKLKGDVVDMKTELKKMGDILVKMAVTDQRLKSLEEQMSDLRHGKGFVLEEFAGKRII